MKLDFVIPSHPKDKNTLLLSVEGVKKHTNCNRIFVVSPEDIRIKGVINIKDKNFEEHTRLEDIKQRWQKENRSLAHRSSWIFQQTLKIFAHRAIEDLTDNYVVVDSDTIFIRDVIFENNVFQYSKAEEYHMPYLETYSKMTKGRNSVGFSFIAHHMCFSKFYMEEMIKWVEELHGKKFMSVLLDSINYSESSTFSEWDFYGNYMLLNHKGFCSHRQLKWRDLDFIPRDNDMIELSREIDFISPHAWRRAS